MKSARFELKVFVLLALFSGIPAAAQNLSKSFALTDKSTVTAQEILKLLQKECPDVSLASDISKSDYTLEAIRIGDVARNSVES